MKTCPKCGVENLQEVAACCNCYAPLDSLAGRHPVSRPAASSRRTEMPRNRRAAPARGSKLPSILLLILVLAGAGGGTYWFVFRPTPQKTIGEISSALTGDLDFDRMSLYLSSETIAFLDSTGIPAVIRQAEQTAASNPNAASPTAGGSTEIKCESCEFLDPEHATVTVTATVSLPANPMVPMTSTPQQRTYENVRIPMVREEGKWKIDGMKWIDETLRSLREDEIVAFAAGVRAGEQAAARFRGTAPGVTQVNLSPVTRLIDKELVRRKIDPGSIKPLGIPGGMNMGR